jgi:DNA-binding PadR family transcriptional regulator
MGLIHQKLGFLISSGTVYSLLYSMERKGLIKGELTDGKRIYVLTDQGKGVIDDILGSKEELLKFVRTLLDGW